ncbi:MAG: acyltransferase [Planctomycetes bacterium]|nr:acyltransferase [Planctomycetota bacterium]
MTLLKLPYLLREMLCQAPAYLFHFFFWWIYPTTILRYKAAVSPYPRVRRLMLKRSGIKIGRQVEINQGDLVLGRGRYPPALLLGDRVALGPYIVFITSSYPNDSLLGVHPDVQPMINRYRPITVEDDAWVGAGVIILPNVTIGRCAIVGAGAVVTKDVPPFAVVAGVPAKVLRILPEMPQASERRDPA